MGVKLFVASSLSQCQALWIYRLDRVQMFTSLCQSSK